MMNKSVADKTDRNCLLRTHKKLSPSFNCEKKITSDAGPFYIKRFLINKLTRTPQRQIFEEYEKKFTKVSSAESTDGSGSGSETNSLQSLDLKRIRNFKSVPSTFSNESKSDYSYVSPTNKLKNGSLTSDRSSQVHRYERMSEDASSYTSSASITSNNSGSGLSSRESVSSRSTYCSLGSKTSSKTSSSSKGSKKTNMIPSNSFALRYQKRRY